MNCATKQKDGANIRFNEIGFCSSEHDQHYSITYRQDGVAQSSSRQTLPEFNTIWKHGAPAVMEWRARRHSNGQLVPFAMILRYYTDTGMKEPGARREILVITKLSPQDACHVGYVDATATRAANDVARKVADILAVEFSCKYGKPQFYDLAGFGKD